MPDSARIELVRRPLPDLDCALRKITPSHAPFHVAQVHLLDVTFHERPRDSGLTAWEISWDPVAAIPLGAA